MNSFYTGQKVICINPHNYWQNRDAKGKALGRRYAGPGMDQICLIRGIDKTGLGLLIVGYCTNATYAEHRSEVGYHYCGFRPLVEHKTDISVFTALLAPSVSKVPVTLTIGRSVLPHRQPRG